MMYHKKKCWYFVCVASSISFAVAHKNILYNLTDNQFQRMKSRFTKCGCRQQTDDNKNDWNTRGYVDGQTETTHCHVFDIHVSLSLQLSYHLPVEPLQLQGRKRRRDKREERGRGHTGDYKLDRRMNCNSSAATNRGKTISLTERHTEGLFRVYCACVRGWALESKGALMNESETKRGNAHRLLSDAPHLCEGAGAPVITALLRRSVCGWMEDSLTKHRGETSLRPRHTYRLRRKVVFHQSFWH